ncbi:MAG: hypothetical protein QOJ02_2404 [Acidobacteriota bacterium]|jgi:hypothetical protein|nr:hypothetical protein [Acidobacteriota bacterium]
MLKKISSLLLVAALAFTLGGTSSFAQTSSLSDAGSKKVDGLQDSGIAGKTEAQQNRSLKADISKLVADAKAGKGLTVSDPQNQPAQSNSLSKGWKIAIGVSIALVVLAIYAVHVSHHLFD